MTQLVGQLRPADDRSARLRPAVSLRPGGVALVALAAAMLANTIAGPLAAGWIDYPISESMLNQLYGLEIVTVLLVVPATAAAGVLALREHPLGPLLGIGPSGYAAYMFLQYALGPEHGVYSIAALAHVSMTGLAVILTLWCWWRVSFLGLGQPARSRRWRRSAWLGVLAVFVLLRYAPVLLATPAGGPIPQEFAAAPTFFWSILLLDLGVVVPLTLMAAIASLRGGPLGPQGYYAVVGWFTMVPPSVAAMAAVMVIRDDPYASVPTLALLTVASLVFAVPAVAAVRELAVTRGSVNPRPPAGEDQNPVPR